MPFFKAKKMKVNGKWYPYAVQVDQPFTTDELADELARISTVSRADVYAVLKDLPEVMSGMMAQGRAVRLEGLGTFRLTINAQKQGVDSADEVNDSLIQSVRVRYVPETRRPNQNGPVTRALVSENLRWVRYDGTPVPDEDDDDDVTPGTGGSGSGTDDDDPLT